MRIKLTQIQEKSAKKPGRVFRMGNLFEVFSRTVDYNPRWGKPKNWEDVVIQWPCKFFGHVEHKDNAWGLN